VKRFRRPSPIGLDIGPRSIAAVQGHATRTGWSLESAALVDRPPTASGLPEVEELARLIEILYRHGFTGRQVAIAVPDARLLSSTVELPPASSGAPLEQLARTELGRMHRKDPELLETASWRIPPPLRAGAFTYMMVVGVPRDEVERTLVGMEAAGLIPAAVDIRAWAMARACGPLLASAANVSAVLDLAEAEAVLSVIHSGVVVYERLMSDAGISKLRLLLRTRLELEGDIADYFLETVGIAPQTPEQSDPRTRKAADSIREYFAGLIQEFRTALAYAVHRYPGEVDRIFVHGVGASIPGLVGVIAEELGVEIKVAAPADLVSCPHALSKICANPALTTALGLARHTMGAAA
jgi:type IV pilus assembly protein PilM